MPDEEELEGKQIDEEDFHEIVDETSEGEVEVLIEGVNEEMVGGGEEAIDDLPPERLTREQLVAKITQMSTQQSQIKQQQDTQVLVNSQINAQFDRLADVLQGRAMPQQPTAQPVQVETEEQFNERVRELYHDDPVKAQNEVLKRQVGPLLTTLAGNNVQHARALLSLDPIEGPLFQRFQADVDREVNVMPDWQKLQDPDVYRKALDKVKAKNFPVLVKEMAKQMLDEEKKSGGNGNVLQGGTTPTPIPKPTVRGYSETNYNPKPSTAKRIIGKLTQAEHVKAEKLGITDAQMYLSLKRRGLK